MFLVTGATGDLGARIVKQLTMRSQSVRAFVRLKSDYAELEQRGAEIFIGDLRRDRDIAKAVRGVKYIVSAHGGDDERLNYRANIDLIDAAIANQVEHFVFISVLGCDRGYTDAPTFKAKYAVEKYLQASGLNYTILRPSGFASNLASLAEQFRQTGIYVLVGDPLNRTSIVSPDDVARMAIASVNIDAAKNQVFSIGGPQALERQEIPKIFGRVVDREPIVIPVPLLLLDAVRNAASLLLLTRQAPLGTLRTLLDNEFYITPEEVTQLETMYDLKLESLESYLRRSIEI